MNTKEYTIAVTGGGTGGHVYPALAVIERLQEMGNYQVFWIGSSKGMERAIVEPLGIPYRAIPAGNLRRYFSLRTIPDMFRVFGGILASIQILRKERPNLLFSKGGFVSVPPVLAAKLLKIPVVSHESDIDPGLATKINMRFSKALCVPYANLGLERPGLKVVVTGNPQRRALFQGDALRGRESLGISSPKPMVLVSGGSLGAEQINKLVAESLDTLLNHCTIVHQMGVGGYVPSDREGYITAPFFHEQYGDILAAADLVVCRGGAGSLWEVGLLRKPAIVIPLGAGSSRGDQVRNAELFAESGALITMGDRNITAEEFTQTLLDLLNDRPKQESLRAAAAGLCNVDSVDKIVEVIGAYV